jgi:hypothetical protein
MRLVELGQTGGTHRTVGIPVIERRGWTREAGSANLSTVEQSFFTLYAPPLTTGGEKALLHAHLRLQRELIERLRGTHSRVARGAAR